MRLITVQVRMLAVAVAVATIAGCGGGTQPRPAGEQASTVAGNRQRAAQEAARLLALARVPPGARRLSAAPADLAAPESSPGVTSVVDRARFWRVPMPIDETLGWLRAHPPAGLAHSGSSSGGGSGVRTAGDFYTEPDRPGLTEQQLQIGVAAGDGGGTDIRADGMAVWLDPRPVRDTATGAVLRVTVAGGCPRSARGRADVAVTGDRQERTLLPAGRPSAALVCRYGGLDDKPRMGLRSEQRLGAARAGRLAAAVRALPLDHVDGGTTSCPMDDGSVTVLAFAFPGRPDADLWWARTGCPSVRNGSIVALQGLPTRLVSR